ncbi:MAG: hypothetical protein UV64_C0009G0005 [Parcubacteria group bacterium GW2011_GWC1_43_11b]|nr:MAG: hypothetical protein UV64_C0009G0005 [Parcubacteria group bacterium GW2011_GWC1_43_11b]KKT09297.1 MAG: hypothetical protein UV88_C0012G0004 [Parcubacteria group bacterium GW2011_GWA1_43_21]
MSDTHFPANKNCLATLFFHRDKGLTLERGVPTEVTLFMEEERWSVRGFLFQIGKSDRGRLSYSENPEGPVGVYACNNLEHIREMIKQVKEFTERRPARVREIQVSSTQ